MHVALCKSFAFAQAILDTNNLMHLLTMLLLIIIFPLLSKPIRVVSHYMALPFTLKNKVILRQKKQKNYGNSNISPYKNTLIFTKKIPLKETKIFQDVIITLL
jgi:hypothetical protein